MLDIKFIRENPDLIREAARKKHIDFDLNKLLDLDKRRLATMTEIEGMRAKQNQASIDIVKASDETRQLLLENMKGLKLEMQKQGEALKELMIGWQALMLSIPNLPDISVPEGENETGNVEVFVWGEKPVFDFVPKDHVELMTKLGMVDFDRGTKAHGFRGYFLTGTGADLSWAILNYARQFFGERNFVPVVAPVILRKEYFYATGHLPREAEDLFKTQDDDYLSGTAEVAMMAYHSEETLACEELPKRYLAFSPCYRREAGSHGKDTKGIVRVHEFYKLEQLILCKADHAESARLHEELNRNFEEFLETLGLPYHRLLICGGDLSASKVKQYDTEAWFPSQKAYRELSSASYYHDFQTRRFSIRYDDMGKKRYAHSLNCTAMANTRLMAAIVENYQNADGSITVPECLRKYMGKDKIS